MDIYTLETLIIKTNLWKNENSYHLVKNPANANKKKIIITFLNRFLYYMKYNRFL